ncbi:MAG: hypothetical protein II932_06595 [Treponema sp.]|nr:hypothetical protein [Treponema sp.]
MVEERFLPRIFCTCVASVIDVMLLAVACINFHVEYVLGDGRNRIVSLPFFSEDIFFADFYVFFLLFTVFLFVLLWSRRRRFVVLAILMTVLSANLALYTVWELLSVKIFMFLAWTITVSVRLELPYALPVLCGGIVSFVLLLFQPATLGIVDSSGLQAAVPPGPMAAISSDLVTALPPGTMEGGPFGFLTAGPLSSADGRWRELVMTLLYLLTAAAFFCMYRKVICKWQESEAVRKHLGMAMTQVTLINQELQDYAKNKGREAAEEERLRITRDMHDSCGYVFVNIISLMQACESSPPVDWSRTTEIFETVRSLASQGLQETRQTLRAIRDIQNPVETNLDSLNQIKGIFQKVTGMEVILDRGNIQDDYGRSINKILIRTMQEGLTNAVKHGHASLVCVYFRDDGNYLYMTVKDNGIGSRQIVKGIGFSGMEERLKPVGGELKAGVSAEGGFQLEVKIPLVPILMEGNEHGQA